MRIQAAVDEDSAAVDEDSDVEIDEEELLKALDEPLQKPLIRHTPV